MLPSYERKTRACERLSSTRKRKAQFFSPSKIQRARELQTQREQEKVDQEAQTRAQRKIEKEKKMIENRLQRDEARTRRATEKALLGKERQASKEARLANFQICRESRSFKTTKRKSTQVV
ncbi:hypothetical protein P152DRAFT_409519, partial [Eremomyces bilateralis CBS 781.70]